MITVDIMSSDEVLDYLRRSQQTIRPVNLRKFAEEIGMNNSRLSLALNGKEQNGSVATIPMKYLIRATEVIQALQQEHINEKSV